MGCGEGGEGLAAPRCTAWEEMFQIFVGPMVPSTTPTLQAQNYRVLTHPIPFPSYVSVTRLDKDWSSPLESPYHTVRTQGLSLRTHMLWVSMSVCVRATWPHLYTLVYLW